MWSTQSWKRDKEKVFFCLPAFSTTKLLPLASIDLSIIFGQGLLLFCLFSLKTWFVGRKVLTIDFEKYLFRQSCSFFFSLKKNEIQRFFIIFPQPSDFFKKILTFFCSGKLPMWASQGLRFKKPHSLCTTFQKTFFFYNIPVK